MKAIDPGHTYDLHQLDLGNLSDLDESYLTQRLTFVKREGQKFPGNIGHYPGTITQEVLRALINRAQYVNNQEKDDINEFGIDLLREYLIGLEERAARRHNRNLGKLSVAIEKEPFCSKCGHIRHLCEGAIYIGRE